MLGGGLLSAVDLVVEHGRRQVVVDGALPRRARARACRGRRRRRRRSPGRRTTATPRWALCDCTTAVRADHRTDRAAPAAASRRGRGAGAPRSPAVARRANDSETSSAQRSASPRADAARRRRASSHCAPRLGERGRAHDDGAAAGGGRVHAGFVGQRVEPAVGVSRQTCGDVASSIGLAMNTTPAAIDGDDGAHLQVGRRDRLAVDEQPPGAVAVGARARARRRREARHAGTSSTHASSWSAKRTLGRPGRRVDASTSSRAGRARLHRDDQPGADQCTSARYGNAVAVPLDVDDRRRRGR